MRVVAKNNELSVRAIAGTEVILFGINIPDDKTEGLLGFKIEKKVGREWKQLTDGRTFPNSDTALVQAFMWSDYSVDIAKKYTYRFSAAYGAVDDLSFSAPLNLEIETEDPHEGKHAVYFNRGVAGSQAYSRRFGAYKKWYKNEPVEQDPEKIWYTEYLKPEDVPNREAYIWLSRGLEEALLEFIGQAKDNTYAIRACLYELSHVPAAQAFVNAMERGADVKIVHHAKTETSYQRVSNENATTTVTFNDSEDELIYKKSEVQKLKIPDPINHTAMETMGRIGISDARYLDAFKTILIPRTQVSISHNKFIILLKDGKPVQVWTGSTNITGGGIYGQSNVGQIIRDEAIAAQYLTVWNKLTSDPKKSTTSSTVGMKDWIIENNPNLPDDLPENGVSAIFSPRANIDMLQWYANRMDCAKKSVFFTAAFSMDQSFLDVVKDNSTNAESDSFLRYLLLEGITGHMTDKYPIMKECEENRIAWGDKLKKRKDVPGDEVLIESLTGLNSHVNYIHTKYMLVDALTDDPIVITGSANFSKASTQDNDENMLIIRGNTRVADIYLGEFMRLFNHFRIRNEMNALSDEDYLKGEHLDASSAWKDKYFNEETPQYKERLLFSAEG